MATAIYNFIVSGLKNIKNGIVYLTTNEPVQKFIIDLKHLDVKTIKKIDAGLINVLLAMIFKELDHRRIMKTLDNDNIKALYEFIHEEDIERLHLSMRYTPWVETINIGPVVYYDIFELKDFINLSSEDLNNLSQLLLLEIKLDRKFKISSI